VATKHATDDHFQANSRLAAHGESQTPLKSALFRHLSVAKLRNTQGIAAAWRLDLTKNHSISFVVHFHHGLLVAKQDCQTQNTQVMGSTSSNQFGSRFSSQQHLLGWHRS